MMNKLFWLVLLIVLLLVTTLWWQQEPEPERKHKRAIEPAKEIQMDMDRYQRPSARDEGGIGGTGHNDDCQASQNPCDNKTP